MANLSTIKSKADYMAVLEEIEKLIDADPAPDTPKAERLDLLTLVANDYETREFPAEVPDAVEAMKFRMEQQGLTPRDLVPLIGSRSKVSEILSRKRPLTMAMARALNTQLKIPAKALLQQAELLDTPSEEPQWSRFPAREMAERGWIEASPRGVQEFFGRIPSGLQAQLLYRKSEHMRSARKMDRNALKTWTAWVIMKAKTLNPPAFRKGCINPQFMTELVQLSSNPEGPKAAYDFLFAYGIPLIVEPHFARTYLDGAAILILEDRPIVGMTLRYDRLDNFWFTLLHEVAHIALHYRSGYNLFIDDLDIQPRDVEEREADKLAGETLIPAAVWKNSPASRLRSPEAAEHLARELNIHPAIVAGRMRYHWKAFRLLNNLVGHGEVRRHFPGLRWQD